MSPLVFGTHSFDIFTALFITVPFILMQIWGFISPGLYHHEKRTALPLLFSSIALFYLGVTFAYFIVLVPALKFLLYLLPTMCYQ